MIVTVHCPGCGKPTLDSYDAELTLVLRERGCDCWRTLPANQQNVIEEALDALSQFRAEATPVPPPPFSVFESPQGYPLTHY